MFAGGDAVLACARLMLMTNISTSTGAYTDAGLGAALHDAVTAAVTAAMDAGLDTRLCDALDSNLTSYAAGLAPSDDAARGAPVRGLLEEQTLLERCLVLGLLMVTYYRPHKVRCAFGWRPLYKTVFLLWWFLACRTILQRHVWMVSGMLTGNVFAPGAPLSQHIAVSYGGCSDFKRAWPCCGCRQHGTC